MTKAQREPGAIFSQFIAGKTVETITFERLFDASCAYAREYIERGVRRDDIVLIILRHSPHLFYSFLGATLAGAIASFLPFPSVKLRPEHYKADLQALCMRIKPRLMVVESSEWATGDHLDHAGTYDLLFADDAILRRPPDETATQFPGLLAMADDVMCLQHSSGTTGLKKGVMLTHGAVAQHLHAYGEAIGFTEEDSIASWLPVYHDMGFVACFLLSLFKGTRLILIDPLSWSARPSILLDAIETYRPSFCWLPNFAFAHLARTMSAGTASDLRSIKAFVNCSEPCRATTVERFIDRVGADALQIAACYAMAENVFAVTQTAIGSGVRVIAVDAEALGDGIAIDATPGRPLQSLVSCGKPIQGVFVRVVDRFGRDAGCDIVGQICVAGNSLFAGYYREPERTAERLRDGWYATGDLGFLRDGELYITGRLDDAIIVNGRNYHAHDIEGALSEVPDIAAGRVAVIGVDDQETGSSAVVVLAEVAGDLVDSVRVARAVRVAILEKLGLAVSRFIPVRSGSIVKTTSGKIDRKRNKELYLEQLSTSAELGAG